MYDPLRGIDNFGSLEEIRFILNILANSQGHQINDLKKYCIDESTDYARSFNGIIVLLGFIGWIQLKELQVTFRSEALGAAEINKESLSKELCKVLVRRLREEGLLPCIFLHQSISFDVYSAQIILRNSTIPLQYSGVRKFLIILDLLQVDYPRNRLFVHPELEDFFQEEILSKLFLGENQLSRRVFSQEQLLVLLKHQAAAGEIAEDFVLNFEKYRLEGHQFINRVRKISGIDVGAGFDIVSFNNIESIAYDRFIEVKSFSGAIGFYWSKNEIEIAQARGEGYFLYLVNRDLITKTDYCPEIIQNPYEKIFKNPNWRRIEQSWHVSPINNFEEKIDEHQR